MKKNLDKNIFQNTIRFNFFSLIIFIIFVLNANAQGIEEIDPTRILIYKYGFKKINNKEEYFKEKVSQYSEEQSNKQNIEEILSQNQQNSSPDSINNLDQNSAEEKNPSEETIEEEIESDIDNSGFYRGIDATKSDNRIGVIDKSISINNQIAEDKYYGYKLGYEGVYISPEVFARQIARQNIPQNQAQNSASASQNQTVAYDLKANIGYDFNKKISGFFSYDVGRFSFDPNQKAVAIGSQNSTNTIGVGSQINVSKRLGFKVIYSQQQFDNSQNNSGRVRSDIVRFGSVYSF